MDSLFKIFSQLYRVGLLIEQFEIVLEERDSVTLLPRQVLPSENRLAQLLTTRINPMLSSIWATYLDHGIAIIQKISDQEQDFSYKHLVDFKLLKNPAYELVYHNDQIDYDVTIDGEHKSPAEFIVLVDWSPNDQIVSTRYILEKAVNGHPQFVWEIASSVIGIPTELLINKSLKDIGQQRFDTLMWRLLEETVIPFIHKTMAALDRQIHIPTNMQLRLRPPPSETSYYIQLWFRQSVIHTHLWQWMEKEDGNQD